MKAVGLHGRREVAWMVAGEADAGLLRKQPMREPQLQLESKPAMATYDKAGHGRIAASSSRPD